MRWALVAAVLLMASACGRDDAGRRTIIDACLKGGQQDQVCTCLANESEKRLDKTMFGLVVLGAAGNETETDRIMATLSPAAVQRFSNATQTIARTCGAAPPAPIK